MRTSQAIASSQPPPKASPLTAAIVAILLRAEIAEERVGVMDELLAETSSSVVNALMSAPALIEEGIGRGDHERTRARLLDRAPQTLPRSSITCGAIEFICPLASHAIATPSDERLQLHELGRLLGVGLRIWIEALSALLAEPALGDEPAQDRRRGEAIAVALGRALHALEHGVETLAVGLHERRQQAPARVEAGAGHHAEVDVAVGGDPLLEHEAGLEERLQRQQLDQLLRCPARRRRRVFGSPAAS